MQGVPLAVLAAGVGKLSACADTQLARTVKFTGQPAIWQYLHSTALPAVLLTCHTILAVSAVMAQHSLAGGVVNMLYKPSALTFLS